MTMAAGNALRGHAANRDRQAVARQRREIEEIADHFAGGLAFPVIIDPFHCGEPRRKQTALHLAHGIEFTLRSPRGSANASARPWPLRPLRARSRELHNVEDFVEFHEPGGGSLEIADEAIRISREGETQ
jgi:hypothetical protein